MPKMIFLNLPVADLSASAAFYKALGGIQNPNFSDDEANCFALSDTIFVMLLTRNRYATFTSRPIGDAKAETQALIALSVDTREAVDATLAASSAAGGKPDPNPLQDHGFMYGRSVEDPDGYVWEIVWMDQTAVTDGPPAT